jgi:hypothetical protein
MAEIDVFTNIIATSGAGIELGDGDIVFIAQGVQVAGSIGHVGIYSQAGDDDLTIAGSVYGLGGGIDLEGAHTNIQIMQSGTVIGNDGSIAIELDAYDNIVTNNGELFGGGGIDILGQTSEVVNTGTITAANPPQNGLGFGISTGGT